MKRRTFIRAGALSAFGAASHGTLASQNQRTPKETEGPFYPTVAQKDKDFDLTQINGRGMEASGQKVFIHGHVIDTDGNPVNNATVDIWQANSAGKYRHPYDTSTAPIDENFQGWAIIQTNKDGSFKFKTVLPGAYPVSEDWIRPPHIHFKVTKIEYMELVTQMYFSGQPLNKTDKLLQRKIKNEQNVMIAKNSSDEPNTFYYQIVLEKI